MRPSRYPRNLPRRYRRLWRKPWARRARYMWGFRQWLQRHGYLTPNFRLVEAACKDPARTPVPKQLLRNARNHAFNLEVLRHRLRHPIEVLSWFRTEAWNAAVDGAEGSQHLRALATDHAHELIEEIGRDRWERATNKVFSNGGVGSYPSGSGHVDSRGWRARWSSW